MRGSRLFFGTLMAVVLSTTYMFVRESALGPRFKISNDSPWNVAVTAKWRDQVRNLGDIEPGATISLTVRDEASMVFHVRHADGKEMNSEPVYFSTGITTHVNISRDSVAIDQEVGS